MRLTLPAIVCAWAATLGGCGGVVDGTIFRDSFWANAPVRENIEAELGLAELGKGNLAAAESHFNKALEMNPKDVHALMGLGILYQNTGQSTKARAMYEAVLAIRPKETEQFVVWNNTQTRPIAEIASVNLALIDSGGVLTDMGRGAAGAAAGTQPPPPPRPYPPPPSPPPGRVSGAPSGTALLGRPQPTTASPVPGSGPGMPPAPAAEAPILGDADANVMARFTTIAALRDQGLVTQDEFNQRRLANIGALLPLSAPPPAAGLDRPVPSTEQISGRLRAIGRALEMRAMTVGQHAAERTMILDALMPAAPVNVANPGAPPRGLLEAADAVRRLEILKAGGTVTADEYARERAAIEKAIMPRPAPAPETAMARPEAAPEAARPSGPHPGVHLASYRTEQAAERGWTQLRRAHQEILGPLEHEVVKVSAGAGKGTFFRLIAGPFASDAEAKGACDRLKRRRQYCEPGKMGAG